ncbi:MAG: hypothetical protein IMZ64_09015, partial [Bacteroidetes bacterium]|nr:hypothetical protein [Bacteroidota bacterium]
MNGKDLVVKYYEVFVTGTCKKDAQGVPLKDAEGNLIPAWMKDTNPSTDLRSKGFVSGRFFQTEMVEVNVGKDILISEGSGKTYELGPLSRTGQTVNVFESKQGQPFKDIANRIIAGKIEIIVAMSEVPITGAGIQPGAKQWKIVGKLTQYAMPGCLVEFDCGFKYFVFQRNKVSHITEPITPWT